MFSTKCICKYVSKTQSACTVYCIPFIGLNLLSMNAHITRENK